jgi:transcriptional regulator with XRE-family HTH domain
LSIRKSIICKKKVDYCKEISYNEKTRCKLKERIIQVRKILGLRQGDFARSLGIKQSTLSNIETGQNGVTDANIRLICITFNVNEDWLRSGTGVIFTASPYVKELLENYKLLLPSTQKVILNNVKDLLVAQTEQSLNKTGNIVADNAGESDDAGEEQEIA